jgi:hypothetical protein
MTKGSLTLMHATVSTPLALSSSEASTNPGRCLSEHVGVKAPGTAKSTTRLPLVRASTVSSCMLLSASK